jgi:TRAP-type C4-dicarboxylate transport system permease small subunit
MAVPNSGSGEGTSQAPAKVGVIDRLLDCWIGPIIDWVVGGIVTGLVLMVFSGVLARYVFNYSLAWSDELAGLLFVWLTLMGSVAALRRRAHMTIGFFPRCFGPRGQRAVGLYVMAGILLFLAFMIREGVTLTHATIGDKSAVLRLPVGLTYLSLPVAGSLMLAYALRQACALWQSAGGWTASAESEED